VKEFHFTDAVLFQAPEQLRNPAGYLETDAAQKLHKEASQKAANAQQALAYEREVLMTRLEA